MAAIFNGTYEIRNSQFQLNGKLSINTKIYGPMEVQIDVTKCDLDRTHCEEHDKIVFKNFCEKLVKTNSFWTRFASTVEPKFACPFKVVRILFKNI